MKALVIGQGGREHALVRALKHSASVTEVHALPGSDGIALDATCHKVDWQNFDAVLSVVREAVIDVVIIGPENPLVDGLADKLRANDILVVAPSGEAAQLEGSKIYCKDFLIAAGIPTARSQVVSTVEGAVKAAGVYAPPYVLKADGLAAGKGVFICKTMDELREAATDIFERRTLGDAGARALIEEFSGGYEVSYLVLTDGSSFEPLPLAQDHKRLSDGDVGPNTGGMGVVAPVEMESGLRARIDREVIEPTLKEMRRRGFVYRGVLFVGLMIGPDGPSVLEFNTRFGDPETQAILPLLDGDWGQVFRELALGRLSHLKWKSAASCCVVLAAEGYPDTPVKGSAISGVTNELLHAGTARREGEWVTAGGRVLSVVGVGATLRAAVDSAYSQARAVKCRGLQLRSDIGAKLLLTLLLLFTCFGGAVAGAGELETRALVQAEAACGRGRVDDFKVDSLGTSREGDIRITPYSYRCRGEKRVRSATDRENSPMPQEVIVNAPMSLEPRQNFFALGMTYGFLRYNRETSLGSIITLDQPEIESTFHVIGPKLSFTTMRPMNFGVDANIALLKVLGQRIITGTKDLPSFDLFARVDGSLNFAFTREFFISGGLNILSELAGTGANHGGIGLIAGLGYKRDGMLARLFWHNSSDLTLFSASSRAVGYGLSLEWIL